jgi:hypothetical protein
MVTLRLIRVVKREMNNVRASIKTCLFPKQTPV